MMHVIYGIGSLAVMMVHVGASDFSNALNESFSLNPADISYFVEYVEYAEYYVKTNDYLLDGSDNYTELISHYLKYIESDDLIESLNEEMYTVYNYIDGNYTSDVNYTYTASAYGHTYYSDILDEDRALLLMDENDGTGGGDPFSSSCDAITQLVQGYDYDTDLSDTYCGSVKNQGSYGTCWAFASTAQFECNYDYHNSLTGSSRVEFSECDTTLCSGGGSTSGGWAHIAEQYFVDTGACPTSNYPSSYSECINDGCQSCSQSIKSTNCNKFEISEWWDFLSASRTVSTDKNAMSFNIKVGSEFYQITGKVPVTASMCNTVVGYHSMTIQGVTTIYDPNMGTLKVKNSWGTNWGDQGYFWMSVDAYTTCNNGYGGAIISWNEFDGTGVDDPESVGSKIIINNYIGILFTINFVFVLLNIKY